MRCPYEESSVHVFAFCCGLPIHLVFYFSAAPLEAQSTFGEMIGVVKDPGQGCGSRSPGDIDNVDDHTQHTAATTRMAHFISSI